jgi:hypothetical protein
MKRKINTYLAILAILLSPFAASATLIDFVAMPDGSISTIGDATFSLAGTGEAGDPYVSSLFGGGLWNSSDGPYYPTNTILRVDFDTTVSGLNWLFDNEGSKATTTWTIYDSSLAVLATGLNLTGVGFQAYDLSAYSGISRIEWNNDGNDWLFALGRIEYTAESISVPEPGTLALFGMGLLGMGAARRRKKV